MSEALTCLSIKQPWAHLILHHGKDVENRTWTRDYRGPLVVHASKRPDRDYPNRIGHVGEEIPTRMLLSLDVREGGARGALVGVVDLVDIVQGADSPWAGRATPYETIYHWLLENPRPLPAPIAWSGCLGLWTIDREDLETAEGTLAGYGPRRLGQDEELEAVRMLLEVLDGE